MFVCVELVGCVEYFNLPVIAPLASSRLLSENSDIGQPIFLLEAYNQQSVG
jgi:hypothetical protein